MPANITPWRADVQARMADLNAVLVREAANERRAADLTASATYREPRGLEPFQYGLVERELERRARTGRARGEVAA
jgi:hypothetical protein